MEEETSVETDECAVDIGRVWNICGIEVSSRFQGLAVNDNDEEEEMLEMVSSSSDRRNFPKLEDAEEE